MNARQAEALTDHAFTDLATKADLKELELRLTMRMGVMFAATIAILGTLTALS